MRRLKNRLLLALWVIAVAGLLGFFVIRFDPRVARFGVDTSWPLALLVYAAGLRWRYGPVWPGEFDRTDGGIIGAFLIVFSAAWLPFYGDWRFAYTGDSMGFASGGWVWATGRAGRSLWSTEGFDHWMTWTQSVFFNWPMVLFGPTLFWHRFGKLVVSCGVLVSVYVFFRLVAGRGWALAVIALLATNYYWLFVSHASYEHLDSQIFAFLSLAALRSIWREPQRLSGWALLGVLGGLSLFFSKIGWAEVGLAGLIAVGIACTQRQWPGLALLMASGVVAGLPMLIQIVDLYHGFMIAAGPDPGVTTPVPFEQYVRLARMAYEWPYGQLRQGAGLDGPTFRWPFAATYVVGSALAVVAVVPWVRRGLRIPRIALWMGLLYAFDVGLLALTNSRYPSPSQNRMYHLLPLQMYLACLPFMVVYAWGQRWRLARWGVALVLVAAVAVSAVEHVEILASPHPKAFGSNIWDCLIEVVQRIGTPVTVFTRHEGTGLMLANAENAVNIFYHLNEHVLVEKSYTDEAVRAACAKTHLVCYHMTADHTDFERLLTKIPHQPIPLLNGDEIQCIRCDT